MCCMLIMSLCQLHHTGLPVGWYLQYTGLPLSKRKHLTVCSSFKFKFRKKTNSTNYTFIQLKLGTPCPMHFITEIIIMSYYLIFIIITIWYFLFIQGQHLQIYINFECIVIFFSSLFIDIYGFIFNRLEHSYTEGLLCSVDHNLPCFSIATTIITITNNI